MRRERVRRQVAAWVALLSLLLWPASVPGQTRVLRAAARVAPDGSLADDGLIVIRDGTIAQVGGEAPADITIDDYPQAVLCPGLIDCRSTLGVLGGLGEHQTAVQPNVRAADAFDKYSPQLATALQAGVMVFAIAPDDENLVGGRIAVCQTAGPDGRPRLLSETGPLKLSLSPDALKGDREPTSRSGALGMLRDTLTAARERPATADPLAAFAGGTLTGVLCAPSAADVMAGADLAEQFGLHLVVEHTNDARLVAGDLGDHIAAVIVGPLGLHADRRAALAAGLFEKGGTPVAIAGGLPDTSPDSLRIGAAVACRAGLSAEAARRAITIVPATVLGVSERIGSLEEKRQADVVVFSGDPLDLRSRVLAVYVQGIRVFVADQPAAQGDQP
ncbi:MAG: amidohydrolase family protein [Phycisphaerae bacterium]|jgi:imidazolonepropionase-like amidohydrolase